MEIKVNDSYYDFYNTLKQILDGGMLGYSKIAKEKIAIIKTLLNKVYKNIEIYLFDIFKSEDQLDKHYNQNKNREKYNWSSNDRWKKLHGVDLTEEGFFLRNLFIYLQIIGKKESTCRSSFGTRTGIISNSLVFIKVKLMMQDGGWLSIMLISSPISKV